VRHFGTGIHWEKIHQANLDRLEDPGRLEPGLVLALPVID